MCQCLGLPRGVTLSFSSSSNISTSSPSRSSRASDRVNKGDPRAADPTVALAIPLAAEAATRRQASRNRATGVKSAGSQSGKAKLELISCTPCGKATSSKRPATGVTSAPGRSVRARSCSRAAGSASTASTRQPRRSNSTTSRPSPQPRSTARAPGGARRIYPARRAGYGAAAGRAASRSRRPSPLCAQSMRGSDASCL